MTAHLPSNLFCALLATGYAQVDLGSGQITMAITGVSRPVPPEVTLQATGLPMANIDTALACSGALGPAIQIDFAPVTMIPWADGAWTVDYLVTVGGIAFALTNIINPPAPDASLVDLCVPTDKSTPPNGATDDPEDSPRIVADVDSNGTYDVLAQPSHQVQLNVNGFCVGYPCNDGDPCTLDHCDHRNRGWCTYSDAPDGTHCLLGDGHPAVCIAGACQPPAAPCTGTPGSGLPDDPELCTKAITVAFTNNIVPEKFVLPHRLTVYPQSPIAANQAFTASVGGAIELPEYLLDWLQSTFPGGERKLGIVDLITTVQARGGGATGADVTLRWDSSAPFECFLEDNGPGAQRPCNPAFDVASVPGNRGNTECSFVNPVNSCVRIVQLPTSSDCAPTGLCNSLGKSNQCAFNGFCVTGGTELPLETVATTYTAGDGSTPGQTEALFGWADDPPPPTAVGVPPLDPDGTWNMQPGVAYAGLAGEMGIALRVSYAIAGFQLEGVMAVDSNGPDGVGVPGDFSPTPDSALLSFPVYVP
jgi:hypothetical protein